LLLPYDKLNISLLICESLKKNINIFACENQSYLCEFEAAFKEGLAHDLGAQGVLFDDKKPRVENLGTLSL
jgi:hypothetical protein